MASADPCSQQILHCRCRLVGPNRGQESAGCKDWPLTAWSAKTTWAGNWYYGKPHSSVYRSTHLISSKPLTEYTDYPMPADYPDYPSHQQVWDYLRSYARHFDLYRHIQFGTCIERIEPVAGSVASDALRRRAAALSRRDHCQWPQLGSAAPAITRPLRRAGPAFGGIQNAGRAGRAPRAGHRRRQFGMRHRGGSRPRMQRPHFTACVGAIITCRSIFAAFRPTS